MVDRIAYAGVLGNALVGEVDFAVFVNSNVLKKSVAADSVEDIGFAVLVKVDNLRVAAALVVEHTVVVPAVFVITDKETFRVG